MVVGSKPEREHLRGFSNASKLRNFEFTPCSRPGTSYTPQILRYVLCSMRSNIPRTSRRAVRGASGHTTFKLTRITSSASQISGTAWTKSFILYDCSDDIRYLEHS